MPAPIVCLQLKIFTFYLTLAHCFPSKSHVLALDNGSCERVVDPVWDVEGCSSSSIAAGAW